MSAHGERNLEQGNKAYAASFTQGDLALPPSQKYAVRMYHRPALDVLTIAYMTYSNVYGCTY